MVLTKTRDSRQSRTRDNQIRLPAVGSHERRRHLDNQYSRGREGRRAGERRAASAANGAQTTFGAVPPLDDMRSWTATGTTSVIATTTTTTNVTSKAPATVARGGLEGVLFVNPDATQARARRRNKIDASRSRVTSTAPRGGDSLTVQDHYSKEIRREERVLRNRESAALSRKRKMNRVGELETLVETLVKENHWLRLHAAHLERSGFHGSDEVPPPPLPPAIQRPRARVPVNTASTRLSTAPNIFPATSSVGEEERGPQAAGFLHSVPPPVVVEQAWTEGGTGSAAVACGVNQPVEVWTHDGARPTYSDSTDFCSDSSDAEDTIDRLFVALMAQEAADREEERAAASNVLLGAGRAVFQGSKVGEYALFDHNGARRGNLTPPENIYSMFY